MFLCPHITVIEKYCIPLWPYALVSPSPEVNVILQRFPRRLSGDESSVAAGSRRAKFEPNFSAEGKQFPSPARDPLGPYRVQSNELLTISQGYIL